VVQHAGPHVRKISTESVSIASLTPVTRIKQDLWKSRGAEFITEPKYKYGDTRCYIRDPDGYIIEVGQSKPEFTYG
jgi:hypothetical protein